MAFTQSPGGVAFGQGSLGWQSRSSAECDAPTGHCIRLGDSDRAIVQYDNAPLSRQEWQAECRRVGISSLLPFYPLARTDGK